MKDYRDLQVWRKAHDLTLAVYRSMQDFPANEKYGLTSQLRRAAASIPSNVAEGCGRGSDPDFARCCRIAMGSACEVNSQLLIANDLGYLNPTAYEDLDRSVTEVQRKLVALLGRLRPPMDGARANR